MAETRAGAGRAELPASRTTHRAFVGVREERTRDRTESARGPGDLLHAESARLMLASTACINAAQNYIPLHTGSAADLQGAARGKRAP